MKIKGLRGVVIRCPDDGCECPTQPSVGDHLLLTAAGALLAALAPRAVEALWPSKAEEEDGMTVEELVDMVGESVLEKLENERGKKRSR